MMKSEGIVAKPAAEVKKENRLVILSQQFLLAARARTDVGELAGHLQSLQHDSVAALSDDEKKAFWINLYNAFTQTLLQANPGFYQHKNRFFSAKQVTIAGRLLSLDDIEHGLLRRSKNKWGFGYTGKLFPPMWEKAWRVALPDSRLHFALNCGAKSCPPIAFYSSLQLERQLAAATKYFLKSEVTLQGGTIQLPAILGWFRGDFGGRNGIEKLLLENGFQNISRSTRIRYQKYNWQLSLENYS